MEAQEDGAPWWSEGLRFSCLRCGGCCGVEPGVVNFTEAEEQAMSGALGISVFTFRSLYVWRKYGETSLRERANYDCVFLERDPFKCGIYDARPLQCRTFPFWPEILKDRLLWEKYAVSCPGMNQGVFHDSTDIKSILSQGAKRSSV
jgi:Fe-S-cluster containining protein